MSSSLRVNTIVPSTGTNVAIGTANGTVTFTDSVNFVLGTGSSIFSPASNTLTFGTNDAERLRIDSAGSVIIGDSDTDNANAIANDLVVGNTSQRSGITIVSGSGDDGNIFFSDGTGTNQVKGQIVYNQTADAMRFYTANAQRIGITSTGRIGINQASPEAMLQVDYDEGSSEVGLRLRAYNASGSKTWQLSEINGNGGVFTIRNATNSQDILSIDGVNQRVGVNNTSPDNKLSVYDVGYCGLELKSNRSTATDNIGGVHWKTQSTNVAYLQSLVDGTIRFRNTSSLTERLRITSGGLVGINTASPDRALHVLSTNGTVAHFESSNANTISQIVFEGLGASAPPNLGATGEHLHFTTNNLERVRILGSGFVNIGNGYLTNSNSGLHVGRSSGGTAAGESVIAATLGNGSTMVSALLTVKNAGNRGSQGASGGSPLAKFEFTNGTAFEIDKYGRRTLQYQPGCKVSIDTNGTGGGNNTQTGKTILPFNNTGFGYNIGNHFNTSNHTFTAPLAGRYLVLLSVNVIGDNIVYIYKNGTANIGGEYRSNPTGPWEHCELSGVVECSANDTIQAYSYLLSSSGGRKFNGGSNPGSTWDTLSIYYLG